MVSEHYVEDIKVNLEQPSRRKLWMAAIKPPMYSVAIMPIWVGSAVALWDHSPFQSWTFSVFLGSAVLILVWLNITNDVFDSETGIDVNKHHSLVNLTGKPKLLFALANTCLALGLLGILSICWQQQDPTIAILVGLCCLLGYTYQGPPFRLGYLGLGEPICFVTFGPLAVFAAYYSQAQQWSWLSIPAAVIVGIVTTLILFCSHFHQVHDDHVAGKKSPVIRLGSLRSAQLIPWICGSVYGITILFWGLKLFPIWTLLVFASLPLTIQLSHLLLKHYDQPEHIRHSKFIAVGIHFWTSLLLGLGFVLG